MKLLEADTREWITLEPCDNQSPNGECEGHEKFMHHCGCSAKDAAECALIRHKQSKKFTWENEKYICECACHTQPVEDEDWK